MMTYRIHWCLRSIPALLAGIPMSLVAVAAEQPPSADYHAVGHGPDWQLDIDYDSRTLDFTSEEGSGSYRYVKLNPNLDRGDIKTVSYRVVDEVHHMSVVVLEKFCQDVQSGKAYGATVNVYLDGRGYVGCGEPVVERSLDAW